MILIVGGAGYIGSHVVKKLLDQNNEVVVLDNLSTGHREAIDYRAIFIKGDISDEKILDALFSHYRIDGVMHFAANCLVGESVVEPLKYYQNNVASTIVLLRAMINHNIKKFIFSSTCATYGIPDTSTIDESCPTRPINPYGSSKLMVEQILQDFSNAYGLSFRTLRYFNAAGADPSGDIGEDHKPETHLIPTVLQHLLGKIERVPIFGIDYDTPDGTCVRDYIHVNDLAHAHILAFQNIKDGVTTSAIYNLGTGHGYSVKEIITMCEKVTGRKAKIVLTDRREGDPHYLVASYNKISQELEWNPQYSLQEIIETAWRWHLSHPDGYKK